MQHTRNITLEIRPSGNAPLLIFCAFTVPLPLWAILVGDQMAWLYALPLAAVGLPGLLYAIHLATRRLRIVDHQVLLQSRIATQRMLTSECELVRLRSYRSRGDSHVRICLSSATRSLAFQIDDGLKRRCRILLSRACTHAIVFDADIGRIARWPTRAPVADLCTRIRSARWQRAAVMALCIAVATGQILAGWWLSYAPLIQSAILMVPPIVWSASRYLESEALLEALKTVPPESSEAAEPPSP